MSFECRSPSVSLVLRSGHKPTYPVAQTSMLPVLIKTSVTESEVIYNSEIMCLTGPDSKHLRSIHCQYVVLRT